MEQAGEVKNYLPTTPWWRRPWGEALIVSFSLVTVLIFLFVSRVAVEVGSLQQTANSATVAGLGEGGLTTSTALATTTEAVAPDAEVGAATLGREGAGLTIVEFADFGCPFSRDVSFTMREMAAKYPARFHYVYRDFPILDLHPDSEQAARAARCAGEQGKFWAFHDKLYANQSAQDAASLHRYAAQVGLDVAAFSTCFESGRYAKEVQKDFEAGVGAGVRGTPTFFVNGLRVEGALVPAKLESLLQKYADR